MADLVTFDVARDHLGDDIVTDDSGGIASVAKQFVKGDTRTADPSVVKALVDNGVLVDPNAEKADDSRKTKVAPKVKNKTEGGEG
jgi:hypothetical protein